MRNEFHETLDSLAVDLADMCGRTSVMMHAASGALLTANLDQADRLQLDLKRLTGLGNTVHDRAYSLLALQAPVAKDLRTVVCALHIAADADRMGALAAHVARAASRRYPDRVVPDDVEELFADMGATAVELADLAQVTVQTGDTMQARRVCDGDDRMDDLHRQLFTHLISPTWRHGVTAAADLVLVGRFYERFADHAVEIARRVYFQTTGTQLSLSADPMPPARPLPG
ncbi:phosphate signaling complex protein PhoU [Mycolicibacterium sp.]|uniref:phosphate signaling complex protein PhoU n=1 Tax=Mycolicibacterium sp. TaxID=2320850 RepID=UPI003D0FDE7C